jgi:hypothetical protein
MKEVLFIEMVIANGDWYDNHDINSLSFRFDIDTKICDFDNVNDNKIFNTVSTGYIPTLNDKLYFAKGVNIPRVKLKNLAKDYKIKSTTNLADASAIFVSENSNSKYTTCQWTYTVDTVEFKQYFEDYLALELGDDYYNQKVIDALEFYTEESIGVSYNTRGFLESSYIPFRLTSGTSYSSKRYNKIQDEYLSAYHEINKSTLPVYDESELLKHLNGNEALGIDSDMYDSLCEMFNSSDTDNHTIAMEIMANSNFENSVLYLSLLFYSYSGQMQQCRSKGHVNFKSLLSLMTLPSSYFRMNIDDVMDKLKKHKQLTKENVDIVLKLHGDDITDGGNSLYFRVKTITLCTEYLEVMDFNYTFVVQEDFVASSPEIELPDLEEEAVVASIATEPEKIDKVLIDFDNVNLELKTNTDGYFL